MRQTLRRSGLKTRPCEHVGECRRLAFGLDDAKRPQRGKQELSDGHAGTERFERILEDELHLSIDRIPPSVRARRQHRPRKGNRARARWLKPREHLQQG